MAVGQQIISHNWTEQHNIFVWVTSKIWTGEHFVLMVGNFKLFSNILVFAFLEGTSFFFFWKLTTRTHFSNSAFILPSQKAMTDNTTFHFATNVCYILEHHLEYQLLESCSWLVNNRQTCKTVLNVCFDYNQGRRLDLIKCLQ